MQLDKSLFDPIMGRDEEIVEIFKPNKIRYTWIGLLSTALICGILFALMALTIVACADDGENVLIPILLALCFFGVIFAFVALFLFLSYSKLVYCYTNKRIIIRSGIIGVDFKTLEYSLIGGISVNVGLFDKFIKPNTGTISFASAAAPVQASNSRIAPNVFVHLDNPYDVYKRIKEIYDNYKAN